MFNQFNKKNTSIFFLTVAMFVFIGAFGYGYFQLSKVNTSLVDMITTLQMQAKNNEQEIVTLQQALQQLQSSGQQAQGHVDASNLVQAEHLVQLANDQLIFSQNTSMAITLLQRADQVLVGLQHTNVMPIRQAIAEDIANLQAHPQADVTQLYLLLTALNEQIDKLPLPIGPMQPEQQVSHISPDVHLPWWRLGLSKTWDVLKKIVIVRYNQSNMPPLVLPEERHYLFQNLHAEMQQAIWGLLHGNEHVYQYSLGQVISWIQYYFVVTAPETQAMLKHLQALQHVNVQPAKVDLNKTLKLFASVMTN